MKPDKSNLSRRDFSKLTMAAFGGLVAGASVGVAGPNSLWAAEEGKEMNVCRGLNTCKNHKDGKNDCAGTGACASVEAHGCNGDNACKGQGGCGDIPGTNACKGKGRCSVPLSDAAWQKAREHFEKAMKAAGKKFGPAPPKAS